MKRHFAEFFHLVINFCGHYNQKPLCRFSWVVVVYRVWIDPGAAGHLLTILRDGQVEHINGAVRQQLETMQVQATPSTSRGSRAGPLHCHWCSTARAPSGKEIATIDP